MSSEKLTEIIAKAADCDPRDVKPDAELESLGIGSLKAITLIFDIEEAYNIEIPDEAIPSMLTVNDNQENLSRVVSVNPA